MLVYFGRVNNQSDFNAVMQELILSLTGYEGDFSNENIKFFHPSEREIVLSLGEVGQQYKLIKERVLIARKMCCSLNIFRSQNGIVFQPSLYLKGICSGIEEILDSYLSEIVSLEKLVKQDTGPKSNIPLSFLQLKLKDYVILFPQLVSFGERLFSSEELRGGILLDFLIKKYESSVFLIKACFKRILYHCNKIFIKNIISWIIYGILLDKFSEFFIYKDLEGNGDYKINIKLLPSFIPLSVAEKILFIGKAVQVLQKSKVPDMDINMLKFIKTLQSFEESDDGSILIYENFLSFQYSINQIFKTISQYLWKFIMVENDFVNYLKNVKDYFLLSKGEFWQSFICNIEKKNEKSFLVGGVFRNSLVADLNKIFISTGRELNIEKNEFFNSLRIGIATKKQQVQQDVGKFGNISLEPFASIVLELSVKYPLNLFFTPVVIEKYQRVFQLLFLLKKIKVSLQKSWKLLTKKKIVYSDEEGVNDFDLLLVISTLNSNMLFIIDNLQFCFHFDIIEKEFKKVMQTLEEKGKTENDFESVSHNHAKFLNNILNYTFINTKEIRFGLYNLFKSCNNLYEIIKINLRNLNEGKSLSGMNTRVIQIVNDFKMQTKFLLKILAAFQVTNPNLNQLLLRINFNYYFDK